MMSYREAIDYLFNQRPAFERQGAGGYKPGLATTIALDDMYGNPHRSYKIIHIAGTNGKGSVSSLIAATLQSQGYKVGLYTSPHFVDFAERIKVNGVSIPHDRVNAFVEDFKERKISLEPSFFELTTIMAFKYFEECQVDFAVVEVGLGGRLDSTNIVSPILSVITNISIDHTEFLGNTLSEIAFEKAGIIKPGVPVVTGMLEECALKTIKTKALECNSTVYPAVSICDSHSDELLTVSTQEFKHLECELTGEYQHYNIATAITAIMALRQQGIAIEDKAVYDGFRHVCSLTSFRGRWTVLNDSPMVICDSAHNIDGITAAMHQLSNTLHDNLHIVFGVMADKDLSHILALLPKDAKYYFTQASTPRALKAHMLASMAAEHGLNGCVIDNTVQAYNSAMSAAREGDVVYVGGSMYVLAELFEYIDK